MKIWMRWKRKRRRTRRIIKKFQCLAILQKGLAILVPRDRTIGS